MTPERRGVEHVELGYAPTLSFDVEKREGRWIVVGFTTTYGEH
jgi:hypothetical protein